MNPWLAAGALDVPGSAAGASSSSPSPASFSSPPSSPPPLAEAATAPGPSSPPSPPAPGWRRADARCGHGPCSINRQLGTGGARVRHAAPYRPFDGCRKITARDEVAAGAASGTGE
jgi:hypothetical protein